MYLLYTKYNKSKFTFDLVSGRAEFLNSKFKIQNSKFIYFADPAPPSGGGEPPRPEETPVFPEEYTKAKEELDKKLADGSIKKKEYDDLLKKEGEKWGVEKQPQKTPEEEADIAKAKAKTREKMGDVLRGEGPEDLAELSRGKKKKELEIEYPEYDPLKMDKLKTEMGALEREDEDIYNKIKALTKLINIEEKDDPENLLYDPDDVELQHQFNLAFHDLRKKYVQIDGKTQFDLNKELVQINEHYDKTKKMTLETLKRKKHIEDVLLPQLKAKEDQFNDLLEAKKRQGDLEKKFKEKSAELGRMSQSIDKRIDDQVIKSAMLENAKKLTGINLNEGARIKFTQLEEREGGTVEEKEVILTIKKLGFERNDEEINPGKKYEYNGPIIELIEEDNKNSVFAGTYNIGKFKKLVDQHDVVEVIGSLDELNENLGFDAKIKEGMELEFNIYTRKEENKPLVRKPQTVKIEKIADGKITLDKEVEIVIDPTVETGRRKYKEMSFGEFAKWYRHAEALEQIKGDEKIKLSGKQALKRKLEDLNLELNNQLNRNPDNFPEIQLTSDEPLRYLNESKPEFIIENVKDDGTVKIKGDGEMTPTQFYRWVKDNGIEHHDPIKEAEKKVDFLKDGDVEEYKKEKAIEEAKEQQKLQKLKEEAEKGSIELEKKGHALFGWNDQGAMWNKYNLWHDMRFLSFADFKEMGKTIWEFIKRRYTRRMKYNYGMVGSALPGRLGTEFDKIKQGAENDEMGQYKEAMQNWGMWQLKDCLYDSSNTDEVKAIFNILADNGELRWDDERMYRTLERVTQGRFKVNSEADCKKPIDHLFGQGQFAQWYSKNINTYNSNKSSYTYKGKQLETSIGGIGAELQRLLTEWKNKEYVNPMEYEELIGYSIKNGKMKSEQKMFYLISGVITKSDKYGTLLHMDRIGELDGTLLNQYPFLDYLTQPSYREWDIPAGMSKQEAIEKQVIKQRKLEMKDLVYLKDKYFKSEYEQNAPGAAFSQFLWEHIAIDPNYRARLSKGLRHADVIDHEDAPFFIPPSSMEEVGNLLKSAQGSKKYFTPEGYMNAYSGYSQYLISLAKVAKRYESDPEEQKKYTEGIMETLRSFVKFDCLLNNRMKQEDGDAYQRLGSVHYNRPSVIDGLTTGHHQKQLRGLLLRLNKRFAEYGESYGDKDVSFLFDEVPNYRKYKTPEALRKAYQDLEMGIDQYLKFKVPEWIKLEDPDTHEKIGVKIILEEITNATHKDDTNIEGLRGLGYIDKSARTVPKEEKE